MGKTEIIIVIRKAAITRWQSLSSYDLTNYIDRYWKSTDYNTMEDFIREEKTSFIAWSGAKKRLALGKAIQNLDPIIMKFEVNELDEWMYRPPLADWIWRLRKKQIDPPIPSNIMKLLRKGKFLDPLKFYGV